MCRPQRAEVPVGERHYVLGNLGAYTQHLRLSPVDAHLIGPKWRKFFERALSAGWIERTDAID